MLKSSCHRCKCKYPDIDYIQAYRKDSEGVKYYKTFCQRCNTQITSVEEKDAEEMLVISRKMRMNEHEMHNLR